LGREAEQGWRLDPAVVRVLKYLETSGS
jgi:hypothetical protein